MEPDPLLDGFVGEVADALRAEQNVQGLSARRVFGRALGHLVADDRARQLRQRKQARPLGIEGYGADDRPRVVLPPARRHR